MGTGPEDVDHTPIGQYTVPRDIAVLAMSTLIRHDATDLAPMLFGPVGWSDSRCPHCHWTLQSSRTHHAPTCPTRKENR